MYAQLELLSLLKSLRPYDLFLLEACLLVRFLDLVQPILHHILVEVERWVQNDGQQDTLKEARVSSICRACQFAQRSKKARLHCMRRVPLAAESVQLLRSLILSADFSHCGKRSL